MCSNLRGFEFCSDRRREWRKPGWEGGSNYGVESAENGNLITMHYRGMAECNDVSSHKLVNSSNRLFIGQYCFLSNY